MWNNVNVCVSFKLNEKVDCITNNNANYAFSI